MSDPGARLHITESDDLLILVGQIDVHTASDLASRLDPLPDGETVVLDVDGVEFIDSSGLRVLVDVNQRATDVGRRLVLRNPSPAVRRLLEISGLQGHLDTETT